MIPFSTFNNKTTYLPHHSIALDTRQNSVPNEGMEQFCLNEGEHLMDTTSPSSKNNTTMSTSTTTTISPSLSKHSCTSSESTTPIGRTFLTVSHPIVRQSSDTSHNYRNKLERSEAICEYDRPSTSCNLTIQSSYEEEKFIDDIECLPDMINSVDTTNDSNYVRLKEYRSLRDIGSGSYGIVKLAYNQLDDTHYAMKILNKNKLIKKFARFRRPPPRANKAPLKIVNEPIEMVKREIAILRKLNHPNVVKLIDALDDNPEDDNIYIIFEYVTRGSISIDIPLQEETARRYFRDTVSGIEYLHFHKVVHRDIKPSNLLISEDGRVKIADFGVSEEFVGFDAFFSGTAGTPAFMSPEAVKEDNKQLYSGKRQDIWSLGITLYCFVVGKVPFFATSPPVLFRMINNDPLEFPPHLNLCPALTHLIRGIIEKDPCLRMTLDEIKQHKWVTNEGKLRMKSEQENCHSIEVTAEEVCTSIRSIPSLDTLILVKAMVHRKKFCNPYKDQKSDVGRTDLTLRKSRSAKNTKHNSPNLNKVEQMGQFDEFNYSSDKDSFASLTPTKMNLNKTDCPPCFREEREQFLKSSNENILSNVETALADNVVDMSLED